MTGAHVLVRRMAFLPFFAEGPVIAGFGRGSKSLGIPTANFPDEIVSRIPPEMESGVYYGFANIDAGPVHQMVLSVGWNPHFNNQVKTMETHILHDFGRDFYGSWMRVAVVGFIRSMESYSSLDLLIAAIHADISVAKRELEKADIAAHARHPFFQQGLQAVVSNSPDATDLSQPQKQTDLPVTSSTDEKKVTELQPNLDLRRGRKEDTS